MFRSRDGTEDDDEDDESAATWKVKERVQRKYFYFRTLVRSRGQGFDVIKCLWQGQTILGINLF